MEHAPSKANPESGQSGSEDSQHHNADQGDGSSSPHGSGKSLPSDRYTFRSADGQVMQVPPDGNLGLLAAGYRGIMLWREARAASGWTAAKAGEAARLAFQEQKQASKAAEADRKQPEE